MSNESNLPRVRVAGVILKNDSVLMIAHKKNNSRYWLLPGGGVSCMESLDDALKREFQEELNIEIEVGDVALMADSIDEETERHIINVCFFCKHVSGELKIGQEEILDGFGFFNKEEIAKMTVYPPFNNEIVKIINGTLENIYLGRLWLRK